MDDLGWFRCCIRKESHWLSGQQCRTLASSGSVEERVAHPRYLETNHSHPGPTVFGFESMIIPTSSGWICFFWALEGMERFDLSSHFLVWLFSGVMSGGGFMGYLYGGLVPSAAERLTLGFWCFLRRCQSTQLCMGLPRLKSNALTWFTYQNQNNLNAFDILGTWTWIPYAIWFNMFSCYLAKRNLKSCSFWNSFAQVSTVLDTGKFVWALSLSPSLRCVHSYPPFTDDCIHTSFPIPALADDLHKFTRPASFRSTPYRLFRRMPR